MKEWEHGIEEEKLQKLSSNLKLIMGTLLKKLSSLRKTWMRWRWNYGRRRKILIWEKN